MLSGNSSMASSTAAAAPSQQQSASKVLLMGRAGAGKTSMRSIIFASYVARETTRLQPTNQVEHSTLRFLGNLMLNLWDCGGQDVFMENYFESQKEHIFRNTAVLIYVVSVTGGERNKELAYFRNAIENLRSFSPQARVFVLVHKIDLVPPGERSGVFAAQAEELRDAAGPTSLEIFATSIWDETLYKAWSSIVYALVPNSERIERNLSQVARATAADEVVLFEKATFLVIAHVTNTEIADVHRFEKISNIVKQFKLSASKQHATITNVQIKSDSHTFRVVLERFTPSTFIMLVFYNLDVQPAAVTANLSVARRVF